MSGFGKIGSRNRMSGFGKISSRNRMRRKGKRMRKRRKRRSRVIRQDFYDSLVAATWTPVSRSVTPYVVDSNISPGA